jgi:homopolymeric O-antigen transport system ATP-binding protein
MSEAAIRVENLGKRYRIGSRQRYRALRDVLAGAFSRPFASSSDRSNDYVWALEGVHLEIAQGGVVGLIGRNGAGKTTLLKILSRITRPTVGYADIEGRVGSLLEVGTGFHPELTGRENVFLSGAILGMRRSDIVKKFDEIVSFAEVERFIDTPLKHFSTGMQMRLAFAVAAHLEPEILLVDEVLAVGDQEFQKKCIGKMDSVTRTGRTIVFVSHQMNQIRRLCQKCVWISDGKVKLDGPMLQVVSAYESSFSTAGANGRDSLQFEATRFVSWRLTESTSGSSNVLDGFGTVEVEFILFVKQSIRGAVLGVALFSSDNQLIWATDVNNLTFAEGNHTLRFRLPSLPIRPGLYHWETSIWDRDRCLDQWTAIPDMVVGTRPVTHQQERWQGVLNTPWEFETEPVDHVAANP